MSEDPISASLLMEILRLAIEVDGLLEDGPFRLDKALELRQRSYDLIKRLEPYSFAHDIEGLLRIVGRSFVVLQTRLSQ